MSEPSRPDRGAVDPDPSSARTEPSVRLTSQTIAAPADDVLPPDRTASAAGPGPDASADTVSSADDGLGLKAAEVLASMIADPGPAPAADDSDPATFQLVPPELVETVPDVVPGEASGRLGHVAGYKILRVLGRGAMGVVYKARQRGLSRIVALKMIATEGHHNPSDLARFRREAMAVAELQHPNIVQIYEVGEDNGRPFFSLEYVAGESLARKIAGTPRPPAESARLVRSLADAMEYAHGRGIIHRDLKPANIMLTPGGEPKVSDFGLAKRLQEDAGQTQTGSILGTPSYMAPEQAAGKTKEIGPCSDIYALGGILYELLTGRPPFRAATLLDTLQQVREQEPIPPSQFQPNVPRELETICLKCLQKDPVRRYATAAALGEDLGRFLAGEPILARPVGRAERVWRWCRRNPRVAALVGTVALLMVAWAATATGLYRLARANERTARANADRADRNATLAEHNAREARARAEEALANAETARRNAERASTNEARARSQQLAAQHIAQDAIVQMIHLGEQVMRRLLTKHDPARAEAEWLRLRDDLLAMLRKELIPLAERIEAQQISPFGFATLHQRLGDLFRRLGQVEDARREYQQGFDKLARIVRDQPNNDVARANQGVMLLRLGELAMEQGGDAAGARDAFRRAWEIQDDVAEHPRSGNYSETDNHRILSGIAIKQGLAELGLGHPFQARERFRRALELRQAWVAAEPRDVSATSYTSEAEVWLAVAFSHLGDGENARRHFEEALHICAGLADRFPRDFSFKGDLASVHGEHGAALARDGRDDEAEAAWNRSLSFARAVLRATPTM